MTPGDLLREPKNKSIRQAVEPKINFAAEFLDDTGASMEPTARPYRWSNWKIALKTAEFNREDACELVWEFATSSDSGVTGNCRARDMERVAG
jgi:hypothetical protein